jgi:hypothetical protein
MAASAESLATMQAALPKAGAVGRQGGFMWLVKPGAFVEESLFGAYMDQWTRYYLDAGGGQGRLPGTRGAQREAEGFAQGLEVPAALESELIALGRRLGIAFPPAPGA